MIDKRQEAGNDCGCGLLTHTVEGRNPFRDSIGDYTWSGAFGTYFSIDPKVELFGIILFQTPAAAYACSAAYRLRIRNLAYEAFTN